MTQDGTYTAELVIKNPLGFHVRPIQRFVELARAFKGDVQVQIGSRQASGKSVMGLMSLGGRHGSKMKIVVKGEDAKQAMGLLRFLVERDFFVEDHLDTAQFPERHIERLAEFASCFESEVWVELDKQRVCAKCHQKLRELGVQPTSAVVFHASGKDAEQALQVLEKLAKNRFYVEEEMSRAADEEAQ